MAWETRQRGGRYYTRSRKVGGRVQREYLGSGPSAEALAALDAIDREEREAAARRQRAERERDAEAFAVLARLNDAAEAVARAALVAAGYRQHRRGEWRRRRGHGDEGDGEAPGAAG